MSEETILCISFHDPPPLQFEECIGWLSSAGFSFISQDQMLEVARSGQWISAGSVWVTLDDGWQGNLRLLPVIERHRVPVTIFAVTSSCETSGVFWWTVAREYRRLLPQPFRDNPERLWHVPETERQQIVAPLLRTARATHAREALSPSEINRLSGNPLVTFGSHTMAHPRLACCDDEQLESELRISRQRIEEWTEAPVRVFAYPRGLFGAREAEAASRAGYEVAVTTTGRRYRPGRDSPFAVPRVELGDDSNPMANIAKMVGLWKPLTGWARQLRLRA